jgi:Na+/H+-dicarboxylate symporter
VPEASSSTSGGRTGGSTIRALTRASLIALVLGVGGGFVAGRGSSSETTFLVAAADAVIRAWTNAFQLLVVPLVVSQLYLALSNGLGAKRAASRLGVLTPIVFLGLLIGVALVSLSVTAGLLTLPIFQSLSLAAPPEAAGAIAAQSGGGGRAGWVDSFLPPNLIGPASTNNLLPLMLFTVGFALAARRLGSERQLALRTLFGAVSEVMFTLVDWVLRTTPLVILALGFRTAFASGLVIGGVLLGFLALEIIGLLAALAALYPAAALFGRIPLRRFAKAMVPAQVIAMATRSSLATVPALLKSAEASLRLPGDISAAIIPLAGATLKLSRAVSGPVRLLFLAHVLGLHLDVRQVITFVITILLLSPSTLGVPSVTSGNRSLPAYVAAGIPGQYVVLLSSTTFLADIFMTLLNATGYMTAAGLLGRWAAPHPREAPAEPSPAGHDVPVGVAASPAGMTSMRG